MPSLSFLRNKTVAVMGLGKSGTASVHALQDSGAVVWAWDDSKEARQAGEAAGVDLVDLYQADLSSVGLMVWSPGIAHTHPKPHPVAERARAKGISLVCDVELLARCNPATRMIAVTGTNGKSTTTSLIHHILATAGVTAAAGGNLGTPALDLPILERSGSYVLELSSYQLELLDQAGFDVAVLLNISADHLSRHGGMDGYVAAKASLFKRLRPGGVAVVGVDDEASRKILETCRENGTAIAISAQQPVQGGVSGHSGVLIDDCDGRNRPMIDLRLLPHLPGRHNWQNACAAYAAARASGIDVATICAGLESYPGLAHRQEQVAELKGIRFINDSKATNADAAEKALLCYNEIYWLAGGQAKEGGIAALSPLFGRIRKAFLIGEASEAFAATLSGKAAFERCGTLDVAVSRAFETALADGHPEAVVLLSPACASWDQFNSFEHRGQIFRQLVQRLAKSEGAG
ncbi:MAG TPA: UDP-N-acetylmuramoyl-L-alanine--D-glutamate ligase [Rhodospirillaceae bacterium]|nr:UDP-N-acetylmuramoyl-L-alanine--D-glutamate ligase [Rhodospirillaceae bacterium]